jgi:hypothetical protein
MKQFWPELMDKNGKKLAYKYFFSSLFVPQNLRI